ncbi:MAG: hypothetical protein E5X89_02875 [Mesorhizobium sp.]|nr:MAG: hypothetical protein E5X88_27615 [Mesorhizobium sp.]TIO36953.1 MAG: hypothetical protein E5X89_02875 [Mesorhizobium sp.]TIP11408.1 MAG: hypothetical protein E5X73_17530 [Mesorhizobium sp.]
MKPGFLLFAQAGGQPLFHLISRFYEHTSSLPNGSQALVRLDAAHRAALRSGESARNYQAEQQCHDYPQSRP